jgi:hypothetical protein
MIMKMIIFLEDLNIETLRKIKWALRYELKDDIAEALKNGVDPETAENDIVSDYINRNNRGTTLEL